MTKLLRAFISVLLLALPVAVVGVAADIGPAFATPPSLVQSASGGLIDTNWAQASFSNFTTAGHLFVVYAAWNDTSTASISDNQGNDSGSGWAAAAGAGTWGPSSGYRQKVWYFQNTANNQLTANVTFSGTPSWADVEIVEFAAITTSNALVSIDHATGTTCNGCSAIHHNATVQGFDAILHFASDDVGVSSVSTPSPYLTTANSVASWQRIQVTGSTTASFSDNSSVSTGTNWGSYVVDFDNTGT